jgi:Na+-translocating ferredoxin:NAD+ oxidoreductase subunit C
VAALHTKYPQGAEKMLIQAITKRKVPSGGLPMDVGVVNHNVGSAVAMTLAIREGKPLIERVVTVTGEGVARPANLAIRVGTLVSDVLEFCGGLRDNTRKLIIGGPMMGLAQTSTDLPVIKGTSGILALTDEDVSLADSGDCIKCAKCVSACPVYLVPTFIAQAAEHKLYERAEKLHATDCIECGCCSFICPARIPLTQWIRIAKAEVLERRKQK